MFPDESVLVQVFDRRKGYIGEVKLTVSDIINQGVAGIKDSRTLEDWFPLVDGESNSCIPGRIHARFITTPATECQNLKNPSDPKLLKGVSDTLFSEKIRLFCGTWNVGNDTPSDNIEKWIPKDPELVMYVIGFQEAEYPPRKPHGTCAADLMSCLRQCIGSDYECIHFLSLWAIRLVIFIRKDWFFDVSNLSSTIVRTGIGGMMGNKGANLISFGLRHTRFSFVNCHLAAHQSKVKSRNENIQAIVQQSLGFNSDSSKNRVDVCSNSHYVFWMGDMNYRINHGVQSEDSPPEDVWNDMITLIDSKNFDQLYEEDQLLTEVKSKSILHGFREAKVVFQPTFKVERLKNLQYNVSPFRIQ